MLFVDLQSQYKKYQAEIDARMRAVLAHGQFIMGPEIAELEAALAEYVRVKHAITVASGTDSLEIAFRASASAPATKSSPCRSPGSAPRKHWPGRRQAGLRGYRAELLQHECRALKAAITPRTKAIMPVSLFGQMPDYRQINHRRKHRLPVWKMARRALAPPNGAGELRGHPIGSTSFFPAKPLGCYGEGGALFAVTMTGR